MTYGNTKKKKGRGIRKREFISFLKLVLRTKEISIYPAFGEGKLFYSEEYQLLSIGEIRELYKSPLEAFNKITGLGKNHQ